MSITTQQLEALKLYASLACRNPRDYPHNWQSVPVTKAKFNKLPDQQKEQWIKVATIWM